jgi:hypothetical protein
MERPEPPTFELTQEFIDYRKWVSRDDWVGVQCFVDQFGYTEWNGAISVRAQLPSGGILPVPIEFTPFTRDQLDQWVSDISAYFASDEYRTLKESEHRQSRIGELQRLIAEHRQKVLKFQKELNDLLLTQAASQLSTK